MILPTFDLDSLAYMSSGIVEGTIARKYYLLSRAVADVCITAVHAGTCHIGQKIVVRGLECYSVQTSEPDKHRSFAVGDEVVLFLNTPDHGDAEAIDVMRVIDNRVAGFSQMDNPGPFVGGYIDGDTAAGFPTLEEHRAAINRSLNLARELAERFVAPPSIDDIPWLLELLQSRPASPNLRFGDRIVQLTCERLAAFNDFAVLDAAHRIAYGKFAINSLNVCFANPAARQILLEQIADAGNQLNDRVRWANLLDQYDFVNQNSGKSIPSGTNQGFWIYDRNTVWFLTWIAEFASKYRHQPNLCIALLKSIASLMPENDTLSPHLARDANSAMDVLRNLYNLTDLDEVKYYIEIGMARYNVEAYKQLNSKSGPMICLAKVDDTEFDFFGPGTLLLEVNATYLEYAPIDLASLVLEDISRGRKISVEPEYEIFGRSFSSIHATIVVTLPPNLSSGTYRFYYAFSHRDTIVGTSYGAPFEL